MDDGTWFSGSHQNSPSSCTVTPSFSLSLLLTLFHSSELQRAQKTNEAEEDKKGASESAQNHLYVTAAEELNDVLFSCFMFKKNLSVLGSEPYRGNDECYYASKQQTLHQFRLFLCYIILHDKTNRINAQLLLV